MAESSLPALLARIDELLATGDPDASLPGEFLTRTQSPRVIEYEATILTVPRRKALVALALHDVTQHHERTAELWRRTTTDPLTGLANHGLFLDRLTQATRTSRPGQVAVLDLDHFKRINDEHGHGAGDEVLREVARRIRAVTPESVGATIARIGGEEFAVLLPGGSAAAAAELVEAMLAAIAERQPGVQAVTASAGVAQVLRRSARRAAGMAAAESLRRADEALSVAKRSGRARLLAYGDEIVTARRASPDDVAALRRENATLALEARTDALTGIGNRRRFDEDLASVSARAARSSMPYGVIFLDLDEFGLVNKAWHEEAGNLALAQVAETLSGSIRSGDVVYRYGGEEFAALLPDASRDGALAVCERMREALAKRALAHPTRGRITASIGVAWSADHRGDADVVVTAAIAAMRHAKEAGRDRIVATWEPPTPDPEVSRDAVIEQLRWDDRRPRRRPSEHDR